MRREKRGWSEKSHHGDDKKDLKRQQQKERQARSQSSPSTKDQTKSKSSQAPQRLITSNRKQKGSNDAIQQHNKFGSLSDSSDDMESEEASDRPRTSSNRSRSSEHPRASSSNNRSKKVREKSRECHNHKSQPFPDTKRKRKQTNPNKHKSNKRTKSTKIRSLFPKRGNRNAKRTEKHKKK